jgi:spore germination cell wall hydrolase CwlJ-like protein
MKMNNDLKILAKTIYGEARGELNNFGLAPLIAVGNVVMNRFRKKFANSIADVCFAPYQFSCWNHKDPNYTKIKNLDESISIFQTCLAVAKNLIDEKWPDLTDGCDHYHAKSVKPFWSAYLTPKRVFGNHLFYNLKNV